MKLGAGLRMALNGGEFISFIFFCREGHPHKSSCDVMWQSQYQTYQTISHSRMKGGHNRRGGNITAYISIHIIPFTQCHKPLGMVYEVRMDKPSRCRRGLCAKGQGAPLGVASWPSMAGLPVDPVASRRCRCSGHGSGYLSHFLEVNLTSSYLMLV